MQQLKVVRCKQCQTPFLFESDLIDHKREAKHDEYSEL